MKVNEVWFRVIGADRSPGQLADRRRGCAGAGSRNNLIYIPVGAAILRPRGQLQPLQGRNRRHLPADVGCQRDRANRPMSCVGILTASHRGTDDYSLVVPAALLASRSARSASQHHRGQRHHDETEDALRAPLLREQRRRDDQRDSRRCRGATPSRMPRTTSDGPHDLVGIRGELAGRCRRSRP